MVNPQEIQKPAVPEMTETDLNREASDVKKLGQAELAERVRQVIERMKQIYLKRYANEPTPNTLAEIRAVLTNDNPADQWKKQPAQMALDILEKGSK